MTAELKNGNLIVTIQVNPKPFPKSASGKTLVVASSHGNQPVNVAVDGKPLVVGLNAYIRE